MQAPSHERMLPFNLDRVCRRGLGRTLWLGFLGFAIIPMTLVGVISYLAADRHFTQDVYQKINISAGLKSRQLQALFDGQPANAGRPGAEPITPSVLSTADRILKIPMNLEPGSRAYLVDANRTLVAGAPEFSRDSAVDTDQTRRWQERLTAGDSAAPLQAPFAYAGPDNNLVIGTYAVVRLGETPYALIVEVDRQAAFSTLSYFRTIMTTLAILIVAGVLVVATVLATSIVGPVHALSQEVRMAAAGRLGHRIHAAVKNEIGELATAFGTLVRQFSAVTAKNDTQSRFISGLACLHRQIGGNQDPGEVCLNTLEFLFDLLALRQADFFILKNDGGLECAQRIPGHPGDECKQHIYPEEGWVAKAVSEKTIIASRKNPASGAITPVSTTDRPTLIAVPLLFHHTVKGVLVLEKIDDFNQFDCSFMEAAAEVIAVVLNAALTRQQEMTLLVQSREQTRKLQVREAALEEKTSELQAQRRAFQASEKQLQLKRLELEAANAQMVKNASDLEAHMAILEKQKRNIENQNTELEKTHRELEEKARQLEISSRYKTEFMANMSHELRTPLNSILLLSRLLLENKEKTLSDRQSEYAQTIYSAGEDLLNLINEILDLAKVESGKMEVVRQAVRVQSIVYALQVSFSPLAEQAGISFSIHVASDVPDQLITDRKRIEQIVKNFLSNAFKFTPTGTIRLEIAVSPEMPTGENAGDHPVGRCLTISVADTGIGIPAAKHKMVFEAFQQVDGSTRRKYGGTGLGLSISRELARLLGGEITLESEVGQGSRFTLHLPLSPPAGKSPAAIPTGPGEDDVTTPVDGANGHRVEPPTANGPGATFHRMDRLRSIQNRTAPGQASESQQNIRPAAEALNGTHHDQHRSLTGCQSTLKGRNVLLVDDDMRTVFAVSSVLENQGAVVLTGKTGKESLDKLSGFPEIDLILMDVMIAEVDGYQAIREIRNRNRYRTLPIIVLTAKAMKGDRSKCIEAGADEYLAKPVNMDKLTSMLRNWIDPKLVNPGSIVR